MYEEHEASVTTEENVKDKNKPVQKKYDRGNEKEQSIGDEFKNPDEDMKKAATSIQMKWKERKQKRKEKQAKIEKKKEEKKAEVTFEKKAEEQKIVEEKPVVTKDVIEVKEELVEKPVEKKEEDA